MGVPQLDGFWDGKSMKIRNKKWIMAEEVALWIGKLQVGAKTHAESRKLERSQASYV